MFRGAYTALITPFKNGKIDFAAMESLIENQITKGIDGLEPCGTTGESPTLSEAEHKEVIAFTVKTVRKRVPVIAGTGSNSTAEAVQLTQHAKQVGADAKKTSTRSPRRDRRTPLRSSGPTSRTTDG